MVLKVKNVKELVLQGAVEGKKVLIRVDFNVPLRKREDGTIAITDDNRIKSAMPTIRFCLENGAEQVILMSHLGRPKGKKDPDLSLRPVAERVSELMNEEVVLVDDYLEGDLPKDRLLLLENLRFYEGEENNDDEFSKKIASFGDTFIEEAFGTCHREHASIVGVPKLVNNKGIGFLVEKELKMLTFDEPRRPFYAIIGAAKIGDKIKVLETLLSKVDKAIIGGGIVFTFMKAKGMEIGESICDDEEVPVAEKLLEKYNDKLIFPKDIVISEDVEGWEIFTVPADRIPPNMKGLDVGDESVEEFKRLLENAATVFWNGPLGLFEIPPFDTATKEIAEFLAKSNKEVIIGGGDTAKAIHDLKLEQYFTHVSTGGGAALKLIAGEELPGIKVLETN